MLGCLQPQFILLKASVHISYLNLEWTQVQYIQVFIKHLGIFLNENFYWLNINNVAVCGLEITGHFVSIKLFCFFQMKGSSVLGHSLPWPLQNQQHMNRLDIVLLL